MQKLWVFLIPCSLFSFDYFSLSYLLFKSSSLSSLRIYFYSSIYYFWTSTRKFINPKLFPTIYSFFSSYYSDSSSDPFKAYFLLFYSFFFLISYISSSWVTLKLFLMKSSEISLDFLALSSYDIDLKKSNRVNFAFELYFILLSLSFLYISSGPWRDCFESYIDPDEILFKNIELLSSPFPLMT